VQNNSIFLELVAKQLNSNSSNLSHSPKKITVTATTIDSSHESGKNFITWAWPASTTVIYNNPVHCGSFNWNKIRNLDIPRQFLQFAKNETVSILNICCIKICFTV
jgi:hypothetical protein